MSTPSWSAPSRCRNRQQGQGITSLASGDKQVIRLESLMHNQSTHPYYWAYKNPPIETWTSATGTFHVVMHEEIAFLTDGTGKLTKRSALFGEEIETFQWRHVKPGHLELLLDDSLVEEHEAIEGDDEWETVKYQCSWSHTDVGRIPTLENTDGDGFWWLQDPIHLT